MGFPKGLLLLKNAGIQYVHFDNILNQKRLVMVILLDMLKLNILNALNTYSSMMVIQSVLHVEKKIHVRNTP